MTDASAIFDRALPTETRSYLGLRIIQIMGMCLFIVTGIPGNFLVCYLVRRTPRLRTVTNLIISNLAVADLGVCLFNMPVSLVTVIYNNRWMLSKPVCHIAGFTNALFLFEALSSLALVSVSRYWCIVQPAKFSAIFTRRKTMAMITATWVLSFLCALPPLFGLSRFTFRAGKSTCYFDLSENLTYTIILAVLVFILPYVLITVPYSIIFRFIRVHSRTMSINNVSSRKPRTRSAFQDFKVTKLLLVVVCVFVACWTPHVVVNLMNGFGLISPIPRILDAISTFLTLLSSSCNPFIYGLMNKKFRKGFRTILCGPCQKCTKPQGRKLERKISGETTRNLSSKSRSSHKREWRVVTETGNAIYETCV